jgi:choline/glycine/proline betaine transport protein
MMDRTVSLLDGGRRAAAVVAPGFEWGRARDDPYGAQQAPSHDGVLSWGQIANRRAGDAIPGAQWGPATMSKRPALLEAMQPTVFLGSAAVVIGFVALGVGWPDLLERAFEAIQSFIVHKFGWFYVLGTTGFLVFVLWLLFSRYGDIRLGGEEATPEFDYFSWFTMMFSAGMGTGLVFWGVAEPMTHFLHPPTGTGGEPGDVLQAMRLAFFHWGLHPWAVYIVFGLSLAYFHFRHGLPLAPRSLLYPVIGKGIYGPIGHGVDILATVGTLFGVATSLGLGAMQINTGVSQLTDIPHNQTVQVAIVALITAVATISVVSGIHRGIRRLSQANLILAGLLFAFVFLAGPTVYLLEVFVSSLGAYLQKLVASSFWLDVRQNVDWQADWTLFYWSWWISWSPFVGVFVARISKGRTVREFITAVLFVPVLVTFLWLSVFGGTGLYIEIYGPGGLAGPIQENAALALHTMLGALPLGAIASVFATLLVVVFFVTSSDSGSLVDDMVTSGGHPNPPRAQRVFWALAEGTVAATLLLAGGLQALRTASLTSGLPMTVFLGVACYGLVAAFRADQAVKGIPSRQELKVGADGQDPPRDPPRRRRDGE